MCGAFQVLCTQKVFTLIVYATSSPWLNICFPCDLLPLSSVDSNGAASALGGFFHDTQAVCSLQLHQLLEVHRSEVCFVGVVLTGCGKILLAVGGGEWGRSSSITRLLPSPLADEPPGRSGSSLTLTFVLVRKSSSLA